MRQIKFRAWSKVENSMLDWFLIKQSAIPELIYKILVSDKDSFIPMLWTGLTDKNGKDIYEGDILINPKKEVGLVVQYEGGFALECKRKNNTVIYIPLTSGFMLNKEIIGNIYESPELIK
jgi:hypothetical protein